MQENNRFEFERLDRERHNDFLSMLKGFVINQVLFNFLFMAVFMILIFLQQVYPLGFQAGYVGGISFFHMN